MSLMNRPQGSRTFRTDRIVTNAEVVVENGQNEIGHLARRINPSEMQKFLSTKKIKGPEPSLKLVLKGYFKMTEQGKQLSVSAVPRMQRHRGKTRRRLSCKK